MRTLLFLILLFLNHFLHSQVTIYGSVKNEKGEFLSGANVYEITQEKGAPSNENGHYFLELKKEDLKLRISYIGYHTKVIEIPKSKLTQDYKLDFILDYQMLWKVLLQ